MLQSRKNSFLLVNNRMGTNGMKLRIMLLVGVLFGTPGGACQGAEEGPDVKYRLSYRKSENRPWVFYADIRDRAKVDRIAGKLKEIGYESRIETLSSSVPTPEKPDSPLAPPPPPPVNLAPQPSVIGQGSASHFPSYYGPRRQPPTYRTPFYAPFVYWGWGGWGLSLGAHPMINHVYGQNYGNYQRNAPVHVGGGAREGGFAHPTAFPGHR